ncbi:hypothetical protein [Planococcus maritimus]|uniref:hypothetical protein n=1 Tax=Planococcus maritimus TaxID=192421 RepID=UPI000798F8AA|nr:hypothetical protein [Planococcus maritimus]KYG58476.1 hypothetical protein AY633_09405 [Planococcus maritimus]
MDMMDKFGLDSEQTILLFSLQRYLIAKDIDSEENDTTADKKKKWLKLWEQGIHDLLTKSIGETELLKDKALLTEKCLDISKEGGQLRTPLYLIVLELSLFSPYFPLIEQASSDKKKEDQTKFNFIERKLMNFKDQEKHIRYFSNLLDIDEDFVSKYQKTFKKSIRSLSGVQKKFVVGAGLGAFLMIITAGLATPLIGGLAAPAGLFGAAATNAGLAAIGGGAVAAGGMGMAGGIAVVVGGGGIFGALSGGTLASMLTKSSDYALREGAKLEVIMKEIILSSQKDMRFAQEMIKAQKQVIGKLGEQLTDLQLKEGDNMERIKQLTKSIMYLERSLKHSQAAYTIHSKAV